MRKENSPDGIFAEKIPLSRLERGCPEDRHGSLPNNRKGIAASRGDNGKMNFQIQLLQSSIENGIV